MGQLAARIGDAISISCPHGATGTIVSSCQSTFTENMLAARIGDMAVCNKCGAVGVICSGAATVIIENSPASREGDSGCGGGCDVGDDCPHGWSFNISGHASKQYIE